MKTQYILSFLAAAAIFAGCAKERANDPYEEDIPELGDNQFFASTEGGEKTILCRTEGEDCNKIFWEDADILSINGSLFTTKPWSEDARKAIFTLAEGEPAPSAPYKAYFPSYICPSDGIPVLPAVINYTYDADHPSRNVVPMYAISSGSRNLKFHNICSVLEVKVVGVDGTKATGLSVSDENLPMSGTFKVEENKAVITSDGNQGVTVNYSQSVPLSTDDSAPTPFYVAVPPRNYTKLNITLILASGTIEKNAVKVAVISRNKVYSIDFNLQVITASRQDYGIENEDF